MTENKEDQREGGRQGGGMANRNSHTSPLPSCSTVSDAGSENPSEDGIWQTHQPYLYWAKLDLVGLCCTTLSGGKIHRQSLAVTTNCCYFPSANRSAGRQPASQSAARQRATCFLILRPSFPSVRRFADGVFLLLFSLPTSIRWSFAWEYKFIRTFPPLRGSDTYAKIADA